MAKEYKEGEKYYLPVIIDSVERRDIEFSFVDGAGGDSASIVNKPGLLLTAEEIYAGRAAILKSENERLSRENDELETTVSELSVLVDKLRKEMAQREELWGNVSNNNDIAKVNLNRLCKQREVLTDRIIALEAELEAERKKNNG